VNSKCDVGKSAIAAAETLHNFHGIPYSQIELTPTCNSYGQAGTLGFTTRFLSALGM
jgi:hypothetical protein